MVQKVSNPSKMTRQDRLAALKEKLKKTDLGSSGAGFWSPKVGNNVIRIMPEIGDMEFFFQTVGRHYFPDNRNVYCPKFTSEEQLDCPICELVDELYKAGDKASKKLAKEIGLRRSYWMNIINRDDEDAGPLIYTPGVQVFNKIVNLINDPDYGDIHDVDDGLDITIVRTGTGIDTDYDVVAKRKSTPLSDDPDLVDEWLGKAKDLSYVELTEDTDEDAELSEGHAVYVYPYNRIVGEFGLDDFDVSAFEKGDDEDEKLASSAKGKPSRKADEDEDIPEAKKEVERRRVARHTRR